MRATKYLVILAALAAAACSDDEPGDGGTPDSGVVVPPDTGVHPDATVPDTAFAMDSGVHPDAQPIYDYGTKIVESPADILAVTPNEEFVVYTKRVMNRDRLFTYDHVNDVSVEIDDHGRFSIARFLDSDPATLGVIVTPDTLWYFSELLAVIGESGKIRTWDVTGTTVNAITATSAKDLMWVSPDSSWALATDDYKLERGNTSTRTADIILINADGSERFKAVEDAHIGEL